MSWFKCSCSIDFNNLTKRIKDLENIKEYQRYWGVQETMIHEIKKELNKIETLKSLVKIFKDLQLP